MQIDHHGHDRCKHCHAGFADDGTEPGTPVRHQVTEIPPIQVIVITRREMVVLCKDGFGVAISLGTAQRFCKQAIRAIEKPFEEVAKTVHASEPP